MFYCCMYFKLDLSFYMFAIIFWIRRMVKVVRKSQRQQIFRYGGNTWEATVGLFSISKSYCCLSTFTSFYQFDFFPINKSDTYWESIDSKLDLPCSILCSSHNNPYFHCLDQIGSNLYLCEKIICPQYAELVLIFSYVNAGCASRFHFEVARGDYKNVCGMMFASIMLHKDICSDNIQ
jgi:hypothetical protein